MDIAILGKVDRSGICFTRGGRFLFMNYPGISYFSCHWVHDPFAIIAQHTDRKSVV